MKIFVTGGCGFIGSNLVDRLVARSDEVLVIDNFATGRRDNLRAGERLRIVEGSIADRKLVQELVSGFKPDLVVHAAASYKDPDDWEGDALTNVVGGANVVQAAQQAGCRRIIYFQTALCYGLRPIEQPVTLNHPILPGASSYAISKTAAEQYIELSGLPPRQCLRSAQPVRPAADVLQPAERGQAVLRHEHPARLYIYRRSGGLRAGRRGRQGARRLSHLLRLRFLHQRTV